MASTSDYISVPDQAKRLGCNVPTRLAILPRGFETAKNRSDLLHESSVSTLRKLWKEARLEEDLLEPHGERLWYITEKAYDLLLPTLFVGSALLSQNSYVLSVALGVIANYVTEHFRGSPGNKDVKLSIVVQTAQGLYKKVDYQGPGQDLPRLHDIVREVNESDE